MEILNTLYNLMGLVFVLGPIIPQPADPGLDSAVGCADRMTTSQRARRRSSTALR